MGLRSKSRPWRWSHGFDNWDWRPELGCWFHDTGFKWYFCLGNRMFHQAYGVNHGDIRWHGSYVDDWHGGIQTSDINIALEWLREAKGKDHTAW